ncbi:hypothetical protein [Cellulomonas composti]|uniref:Uncharacterized protein n=1 Tax=Cellulomonas composti TaxID=266130 RepID=A0A511JDA9_9CELL|nr:hypothetical protein [Cellulomonas composti]GEL95965.1 hypothetical protein CCO02nite_26230 [Cellulomonas composti]
MSMLDVEPPTAGRWVQPFADLVAPAPAGDWFRRAADLRMLVYDRIRQFMSRLALAALVVGVVAALPSTAAWAWWLLTVPAALQGGLEIYLEHGSARKAEDAGPAADARERGRGLRARLLEWRRRVYERTPLFLTGVLGAVAIIGSAFAVAFGTRADDGTGWLKVVSYAGVVLYANSGASGPLLESTAYSELADRSGRWMGRLRPAAWLILGLLAAFVVWWSDLCGFWPPGALPYAFLVCGLGYALGLRIREHDRAVAASGLVAAARRAEVMAHLGREFHDVTQIMSVGVVSLRESPRLTAAELIELEALYRDLEDLHQSSRDGFSEETSVLPDVRTVVRRICQSEAIRPVLAIDLPETNDRDFDPSRVVRTENARFAKQLIRTLTLNAVRAYVEADAPERPLRVEARLEGGDVYVAVTDALPLVPRQTWLTSGGILRNFRHEIERRGGSLRQVPLDGGGKTIEARWRNELRPLLESRSEVV